MTKTLRLSNAYILRLMLGLLIVAILIAHRSRTPNKKVRLFSLTRRRSSSPTHEVRVIRPNLRERIANSPALSCLTLNIFQEASPTLQDDKPKTTLSSMFSKLGLDFIDPQPDMAGSNTNEAAGSNTNEAEASTKTCDHETDGGASTPAFDASFFLTLFP